MSRIIFKDILSEFISLDKIGGVSDNGTLSQNLQAVTPNCSTWLFYCLNGHQHHTDGTPYTVFVFAKYFPFMVWLIPQNKPIGEYVERLLVRPRVRPHHPMTGYLLKTLQGVFTMNTKHTLQPTKGNPTNTPLFAFTGKIKPTQARKPSNKNPQQFDNFLVYVPILKITVYFDKYFDAFAHASYLKSLYPLTNIGIYGYQSLIDTQSGEQGGKHD